jgi:hypothetical protein
MHPMLQTTVNLQEELFQHQIQSVFFEFPDSLLEQQTDPVKDGHFQAIKEFPTF